jgi:hypothetical protein
MGENLSVYLETKVTVSSNNPSVQKIYHLQDYQGPVVCDPNQVVKGGEGVANSLSEIVLDATVGKVDAREIDDCL